MAGQRQPTNLVVMKGKKHFTKTEIEERLATEVQPCTDEIVAPRYLTATQKKQFTKLAEQLQKIKIMGETDCDTLARYVVADSQYEQITKQLRKAMKNVDDLDAMEKLAKLQDRYFKQAHTAATALGLTISSRCKLAVPVKDEEPKINKFAKFGKAADGE